MTLLYVQCIICQNFNVSWQSICPEPHSYKNVKWIALSTEELFVIVPKAHPLAQKSSIKLKELAEESFIIFKRELTLGEMTDRFFKEAGFIPKVTFES
ncbi:LysR substrate-binding domain-containing protein [Desulfitobacterium sp. Sab5]|uniref:LysR substrate-binding domain-containing protein n=1 Tax=Desulfitobacterium nosdiversum TaxID=3375356 RepID=UPI003CF41F4B